MRKLLLFSLAISMCVAVIAQKRAEVPKELRDLSLKKEKSFNLANSQQFQNPVYKYPGLAPIETPVGMTRYDQQTNSTNQNRIYLYEDGTMGVTWTIGYSDPTFSDRGTGYNYFDGNAWSEFPSERLESQRSGWPSYAPLGENGEINVAHISGGTDDGLLINKRENKGTGDWAETLYVGPTGGGEGLVWPRIVTTGVDRNVVHMLSVTRPTGNGGTVYAGLDGALVYSRSSDGAETWEIDSEIIEGMGSDFFTMFNGDTYDWATPRNNTLAFVVGDPMYNCVLMKSTDGGNSWEKTIIWEHPYPMWFNEVTDTFFCMDGSFDVELDMNGMAHLVFGINRAHSDGNGTFWFPYIDGVGYWNETMPAFSNNMEAFSIYDDAAGSEMIEDYNLIGWTQDVNNDGEITFVGDGLENIGKYYMGLSSMVQLVMGDQNQLYVFFTSLTETYDNGNQNYRHLWSRVSTDGGLSWGPFTDLSDDLIHIFDEFAFPSCAENTNPNSIYLVCQIDNEPGMAVAGDEDLYTDNNIVVMEVFKDEITGIMNAQSDPNFFEVFQNYPNPVNDFTKVKVELRHNAIMGLEVYNLMGQLVFKKAPLQVNSGIHFIDIDATSLDAGVYFYTINANGKEITQKMIVE